MKKEKQSYAEMLKDPRWQKKRLEVMKRDGFRCQHCLSEDKPLQVHHLVYDKDKKPWEYENNQLITLCEDCHQNETKYSGYIYSDFQDFLRQFLLTGLSQRVLSSIFTYFADVLYSYNNNGIEPYFAEDFKKILEFSCYDAGTYGDIITASKMGIDVEHHVEMICPEIRNYIIKKED